MPCWEEDEAPQLRLLDLPAKLLVAIAAQFADDDDLAFALACRRLRQAVAGIERRAAGLRLSSRIGLALCSVGKLEWAVMSCGLPLSGRLLVVAAQSGRAARAAALAARARLRVAAVRGKWHRLMLEGGCGRASRRDALGARGWLPVGQLYER
jgi:hypothetical protein